MNNKSFQQFFLRTEIVRYHRYIYIGFFGYVADGSAIETFFSKQLFGCLQNVELLVVKICHGLCVKITSQS